MNFLSNLWSTVKNVGSSVINFVPNALNTASNLLKGAFSNNGASASNALNFDNPVNNALQAGRANNFSSLADAQYLNGSPMVRNAFLEGQKQAINYSATGSHFTSSSPVRSSTYSAPIDAYGRESTRQEGQPFYNAAGNLIIPDRGFTGISGAGTPGLVSTPTTGTQGQSGTSSARGYGGAGQGTTSSNYGTLPSDDEKRRQQDGSAVLPTTKATAGAIAALQAQGQQAPINAPEVPPVIDAGFISKVQDTILNTKNSGLSEVDKQTVYSQLQTNLLAAKQRLDQQVAVPENPVVDTPEQLAFIQGNQDPFGVKQLIDQVKATQTNLGQLETTRVDLMKNVQALNEAYRPIIKEIKENPNLPKALARRKIENLAISQKEVLQGFLDQLQVVNQQIDDQNQIVNRTLQIANFAQGQQNTAVDNARQALQLMISSGAIAGATDAELQQYASVLGMPLAGLKKAKEAAYDSKLDIITNEFADGSLRGIDKNTGKTVWTLSGAGKATGGETANPAVQLYSNNIKQAISSGLDPLGAVNAVSAYVKSTSGNTLSEKDRSALLAVANEAAAMNNKVTSFVSSAQATAAQNKLPQATTESSFFSRLFGNSMTTAATTPAQKK